MILYKVYNIKKVEILIILIRLSKKNSMVYRPYDRWQYHEKQDILNRLSSEEPPVRKLKDVAIYGPQAHAGSNSHQGSSNSGTGYNTPFSRSI